MFITIGVRQDDILAICKVGTRRVGLYRISGNRIISGRITSKTGYPGIQYPENKKFGYPAAWYPAGYRILMMELVLEQRP